GLCGSLAGPPRSSPAAGDRRHRVMLYVWRGMAGSERGRTEIMVADTYSARRSSRWAAERRQPGWIGLLGKTALVLLAIGLTVGVLYYVEVMSGTNVIAAGITIFVLAAIIGVAAGAARWMHAGLAGRVDILSQALGASPD